MNDEDRLREDIKKADNRIMGDALLIGKLERRLQGLQSHRRLLEANIAMSAALQEYLACLQNKLTMAVTSCRWQKVYEILFAMNIEEGFDAIASSDYSATLSSSRRKAIVSCIRSLPLPNSGDFSLVPVEVVNGALALIAICIESAATMLNMPLPHVIKPFDSHYCLISPRNKPRIFIPLVKAFNVRSDTQDHGSNIPVVLDEWIANVDFDEAFRLLCEDVQYVTLSAGVIASDMHPWHAPLLNLAILRDFCKGRGGGVISAEKSTLSPRPSQSSSPPSQQIKAVLAECTVFSQILLSRRQKEDYDAGDDDACLEFVEEKKPEVEGLTNRHRNERFYELLHAVEPNIS